MRFIITAPGQPQVAAIANSIYEEIKNFCSEDDMKFLTLPDFYDNCSYFERRISKIGFKNFERTYTQNLIFNLKQTCKDFQPDFILVLNGLNVPLEVQKFLSQYKIILWLWDSMKNAPRLENFVNCASKIFCFEYDDIKYLNEKYNLDAQYLPLGADTKIFSPVENMTRDIDISFIGTASKLRIKLLEKVCEHALKENWSVKIGGHFYDSKHFWKKYLFGLKNSALAKFLDNRYYSPDEAANLYRRSKICLNINTVQHKSLSPRTFEICATKSFQLMNAGQKSNGLMNLETDIATFDGTEDLIEKISFYLANDDLREKIASAGYNSVMKNCTLKNSVEKIFTRFEND